MTKPLTVEERTARIARKLFAEAMLKRVHVHTTDQRRYTGQLVGLGESSLSVLDKGFALPIPYTKIAKLEVL